MNGIVSKIRNVAWKVKKLRKPLFFFIKRKFKKIKRTFKKEGGSFYNFASLCVKRPIYTQLVRQGINSLHYLNPNHTFKIYCDDTCYKKLKDKKGFDYPSKVTALNYHKNTEQTWQYSKIETVIDASKNNSIFVDADMVWHHEPIIDKDKITFLVTSRKMKDKEGEILLMKDLFNKSEWTELPHYNTGFNSIPSKLMTPKIADDCRKFTKDILESDLNFIKNEKERRSVRRISEEIGINLAIQTNIPKEKIVTLKNEDHAKDTNIIQSIYYGCRNDILD